METHPYETFAELLKDRKNRNPSHIALMEMRDGAMRTISYSDLYRAVQSRANNPNLDKPSYLEVGAEKSIDALIDLFAQAAAGAKLLFHTSGTTANARTVILTQKAILRSAWNGEQLMHADEEDRLLSMLPLDHIYGFVCTLIWPLAQGAEVALGRGMHRLMDDPQTFSPTILPVVPSLLKFLLQSGSLNPELKQVLVGAGPASREVLEAVQKKGIDVRFGYGLTETASGLAMSPKGEDPFSMELCPDTRLRVSEDGEIFVRTPCMMEGYLGDPIHTAEKLKDGELATGDVGYLDQKSRLHITGRKDDVLVFPNGQKVFLSEWEEKLTYLLGTEVMLGQREGLLCLLAVAGGENKEKILAAVDAFNQGQPLGRKIQQVFFQQTPLPRTVTGKLQRWKINLDQMQAERTKT